MTNEKSVHNPAAKNCFLIQFSDGSAKLMEQKDANVKYPLVVINFYQKNLVWNDSLKNNKIYENARDKASN